MARPKLTLFVDVISPFAYLAFYVLSTKPLFKKCDIELIPIFLGGVMQNQNNRPPITIPNKGVYLAKQRERFVKRFKIPIADDVPTPFPQPTINTGRALCVIKAKYPAKLEAACTALFNTFWIDLKTIGKPEVIAESLKKVFSDAEIKDIMDSISLPEFKKKLIDNTDFALENGCFGLPYYIATNARGEKETFWGFDHLGQVVDHLELGKEGDALKAML